MVMVQEDQAREPWSSDVDLQYIQLTRALKLLPNVLNPNTPILGMSQYRTCDTTTLTETTVHD